MKKTQLANDLRARQYAKNLVPKWMVDRLSDHDIIEYYCQDNTTGDWYVDPSRIDSIVAHAENTNHFLDSIDGIYRAKQLKQYLSKAGLC